MKVEGSHLKPSNFQVPVCTVGAGSVGDGRVSATLPQEMRRREAQTKPTMRIIILDMGGKIPESMDKKQEVIFRPPVTFFATCSTSSPRGM